MSPVKTHARVRFGILANQENDCNSPDSFLGLGADEQVELWGFSGPTRNAAGNVVSCCYPDSGIKNTKAMGYILVR